MDQPRIVYTTFPNGEIAGSIARALVGERLAACVNLLPGMRSFYRWEGAVEEAGEIVGIVKTRSALIPQVEERIRELHPYDTPVIIHLAITGTDEATLAWLLEQTGGA